MNLLKEAHKLAALAMEDQRAFNTGNLLYSDFLGYYMKELSIKNKAIKKELIINWVYLGLEMLIGLALLMGCYFMGFNAYWFTVEGYLLTGYVTTGFTLIGLFFILFGAIAVIKENVFYRVIEG